MSIFKINIHEPVFYTWLHFIALPIFKATASFRSRLSKNSGCSDNGLGWDVALNARPASLVMQKSISAFQKPLLSVSVSVERLDETSPACDIPVQLSGHANNLALNHSKTVIFTSISTDCGQYNKTFISFCVCNKRCTQLMAGLLQEARVAAHRHTVLRPAQFGSLRGWGARVISWGQPLPLQQR